MMVLVVNVIDIWTAKVCNIGVFGAFVGGLGPLLCILLGSWPHVMFSRQNLSVGSLQQLSNEV